MNTAKSIRIGLAQVDKRQNWLAGQLGVSSAYVSTICKGNKIPTLDRLNHIAKVFDVKLSVLISWGE